jgi:hypothetical protein
LAEVGEEIAVTGLQVLPELFDCSPLLFEVGINLVPVSEVVGNHAIDLS